MGTRGITSEWHNRKFCRAGRIAAREVPPLFSIRRPPTAVRLRGIYPRSPSYLRVPFHPGVSLAFAPEIKGTPVVVGRPSGQFHYYVLPLARTPSHTPEMENERPRARLSSVCVCVCVCVSEWTVSLNYFLPVRPLISPFYFIPTKTKGRISEIYWNWAWAHFLKRKIKLAVLTLTFLRYLSIFKKMERFFFIFIVANYIWNFLKASSQGNSLVEFVCPKYNLYLSSVHRK